LTAKQILNSWLIGQGKHRRPIATPRAITQRSGPQCIASDGNSINAPTNIRIEHRRIDSRGQIYANQSIPAIAKIEPDMYRPAAAAWRAQQTKVYRIGALLVGNADVNSFRTELREELRRYDYVEGQNLIFEFQQGHGGPRS
jgi:hypothetical protein